MTEQIHSVIEYISALTIPVIMLLTALLIILFPKKDLYAAFISGAEDGLKTAVRLAPSLVILLCAVRMLWASGFVDAASTAITPVTERIGVPSEIIPLLLTRPVSGSASLAIYSELLELLGPDTFPAVCASVVMGSSDTLVYVISVYFSSVGVKKTSYALPCAIAVMIFCIFFSCLICRLWFK